MFLQTVRMNPATFPTCQSGAWIWVLSELFNLDAATGISPDPDPIPDIPPVLATKLWSCHPNPFNPQTTLSYDLREPGMVNLSIFDAKGRLVAVIVDQPQGAGQHQEVWNGYNDNGAAVPSGVYYLKLVANDVEQTHSQSNPRSAFPSASASQRK